MLVHSKAITWITGINLLYAHGWRESHFEKKSLPSGHLYALANSSTLYIFYFFTSYLTVVFSVYFLFLSLIILAHLIANYFYYFERQSFISKLFMTPFD